MKWNWGVVISISCAIGVVVIPVLFERLPGMSARWTLAQAANAVDLGIGDVDSLLDEAKKHLPNPEAEVDYWHVKLKMALKKDSSQVIDLLNDAEKLNVYFFDSLAAVATTKFEEKGDFKSAAVVGMIQLTQHRKNKDLPRGVLAIDLNQIAYFRALSGEDLPTALEEINLALNMRPNEFSFLDTRAWVLYTMGLLPEALKDADAAVNGVDELIGASENSFWNSLFEMASGTPEPSSADGVLTRTEAGTLLWSAGVIHYHRAKILDGLGRTDQSKADWDWLKKRKLPTDDRLR